MIKRSWRDAVVPVGFLGLIAMQPVAAGDAPTTRPVAQTAPADGARPTSQPGAEGIEQLVAQLSSPDWKERRAAQEKLASRGRSAEAALREIAGRSSLDPEARKGLDVVLRRIDEDQKVARTLVTLKYTAAKPSEIYEALGKQAHIEFAPGMRNILDRVEQPAIDVDVENVSFWQALLQVNKQCGLYFEDLDSAGRVELRPVTAGLATTPVVATGPILTTINRIEIDDGRAIDFGGHHPMNARRQANNEVTYKLFFFAWCEPKLKPLSWSIDALDECQTDTGGALKPQFRGFHVAGRINNLNDTQLVLTGPRDQAKKIRKLRLTATFNLELERETLEVPNILAVHNATYQVGGFRMIINSVNKMADGRYGYELALYRDGKSVADWARVQDLSMLGGFKILDADGNALNFSGGGSSSGPNEVGMHGILTCDARNGLKAGPPVKLVWSFASKAQVLTVPLNFNDIPLP